MEHYRCPLHCIVPPYVLDHLTKVDDPKVRELAIDAIANAAAIRATRRTLAMMPALAAVPSPATKKYRLVYDAKHGNFSDLPGTLSREEGKKASKDVAVNEAYNYSGVTYDFYKKVLAQ